MFIAHGQKVRKHSRWIMLAILIVIVPSFVALFTTTGSRDPQPGEVPTFRGKPMKPAQFEDAKRAVRDQFVLSSGRRAPNTRQYEDAIVREATIRIVLLRKAEELGVRVSEEVLLNNIRQLPAFQNQNGQFDINLYRQYIISLNNHGISEQRFQDLMRDQMTIGQLQNLISDAAKVAPQEVELHYGPLNEKLWIELVRFDVADVKDKPAVSDEDALKYFEPNKEKFEKAAQVKVRYARFAFDDMQKNIQVNDTEIQDYYTQNLSRYLSWDTNINAIVTNSLANARTEIRADLIAIAAQRQAGEIAQQLSIKLVPDANAPRADFAKLAAEAGATLGETGYFGQEETPTGVKAGRSFRQAAFAFTYQPDPPFSDPVLGEDGYYVLEYLDSKPARIPEFAEVKAEVVEQLQRERVYEATTAAARASLDQVNKLVASGKAFADAAVELKLKVQTIGPFTIAGTELEIAGAAQVQQSALGMRTNTVSPFIQTADGGLFFLLKDRQPFDREEFEKVKDQFARQLLTQQRQALFESWLGMTLQQEQVSLGRQRSRAPQTDESAPVESAE